MLRGCPILHFHCPLVNLFGFWAAFFSTFEWKQEADDSSPVEMPQHSVRYKCLRKKSATRSPIRIRSEKNFISGSNRNVTGAGDEGCRDYLGAVFKIATGDRVHPHESHQDSSCLWTYRERNSWPLYHGCNVLRRKLISLFWGGGGSSSKQAATSTMTAYDPRFRV